MTTKRNKTEENGGEKECLSLLKSGRIHLINPTDMKKEIIINPSLGDRLQFGLHNYCKNDSKQSISENLVEKLSELCYSKECVKKFTNMERFVGCVYYITLYLTQKEKYNTAINVANSLLFKKEEIIQFSKGKTNFKNALFFIPKTLMSSATSLLLKSTTEKTFQICHKLAITSLKLYHLTEKQEPDIGKKVLNSTKLYLYNLKHFTDKNILEFLSELQNAMIALLQNFSFLDYFCYFLVRSEQFMNTRDFYKIKDYLHNILKIILIGVKLPFETHYFFNNFIEFWFASEQKNIFDNNIQNDIFTSNLHSNLCFMIVTVIFNYGIQFWHSEYENSLCDEISSETIQKVFQKIIEFNENFIRNDQFYCTSCDSPYKTCFSDLIVNNLHKIQYTVRVYVKKNISPDILIPICRKAFRLSLDCIKEMKIKGCSEKQYTSAWKQSVIHQTNLVEDILKLPYCDSNWIHMKECCKEILSEIINFECELPFDSKRIDILFKRWHYANLKLKAYTECYFICISYYISYPENEIEILNLWSQTKTDSSNDIVQEMSTIKSLKNWESSLKEFNNKYKYSSSLHKNLLLMELKVYTLCSWNTFKDPNSGYRLSQKIWNLLQNFGLDIWEKSFALCAVINTNIYASDIDLSSNFIEESSKHINDLINWKLNDKAQSRSLLHAANLKYFLFLYSKKGLESNEKQMNDSHLILDYLKKEEEKKIELGENIDLNLSCDVVPNFLQFSVELETTYLKSLNEILEIWEKALDAAGDLIPTKIEFKMWQKTFRLVANFYQLLGEHEKSYLTWLLYYKLGKLCNDSCTSLTGLSRLIKNTSDVNSSLVKEATGISETLDVESKEKTVLVEFWSALAFIYLKNKKEVECFDYLMKALNVVCSLENTLSNCVLLARFWCLVSQFLCLYPEREVSFGYEPETDPRFPVFRAFMYFNRGVRSDIKTMAQSECMDLFVAMYEVNLWAFYFYKIYRRTDYMRLFLDDLYQIVQKLLLPTRTAELLLRLAEVDLMMGKITECREKVMKLKSILTIPLKNKEFSKPKVLNSPPLFDLNESELELVRLSPTRFLQPNPAMKSDPSPTHLHLKSAQPLRSSKHVKTCKCRLCNNFLILTITMNALALEAELYEADENRKDALVSYAEGWDTMLKVGQIADEQTLSVSCKLEKAFKGTIGQIDIIHNKVQFSSACFLIRYGFYKILCGKSFIESLAKVIAKLGELMKKFSYEEQLLIWTYTELRLIAYELNRISNEKVLKKVSPMEFKTKRIETTPLPSQKSILKSENLKVNEDEENKIKDPKISKQGTSVSKTRLRATKLNFDCLETSPNLKEGEQVTCIKLSKKSRKLNFESPLIVKTEESKANTRLRERTQPIKCVSSTRSSSNNLKVKNGVQKQNSKSLPLKK